MTAGMRCGMVVVVLLLAGGLLVPVPLLRVTSQSGTIDICLPVTSGDTVELIFTNSLYGGDVREVFRIANDHLLRTHFITENAAAAEYYAWNTAIAKTGTGYEVLVPPATFDALPVLVDAIGQYRLITGDREIALSGMIDNPEQVQIKVKSIPLLWRMFGRC